MRSWMCANTTSTNSIYVSYAHHYCAVYLTHFTCRFVVSLRRYVLVGCVTLLVSSAMYVEIAHVPYTGMLISSTHEVLSLLFAQCYQWFAVLRPGPVHHAQVSVQPGVHDQRHAAPPVSLRCVQVRGHAIERHAAAASGALHTDLRDRRPPGQDSRCVLCIANCCVVSNMVLLCVQERC